jgi:hypothetical protein
MAQAQELWSCCATYGYREHTYGIVHDAEAIVKVNSGIQAGTEPADIGLGPILYRHRLRSYLSVSSTYDGSTARLPSRWGFLQELSCPKRSGIRLAHAAIAYPYLSGLSLGICMERLVALEALDPVLLFSCDRIWTSNHFRETSAWSL